MVAFANIFNKVFSLLFAFLLIFTGGINTIFSGRVYTWESTSSVIGMETLVRSQGVTNDGEYFYFSGKNALEKVTKDCSEIIALNCCAITKEMKEKYNSSHIGGISYSDGKIYAAIEDSKEWEHPIIAVFDAETLSYTGKCFELPLNLHKRGAPWVAVNGKENLAFTGDSRNYSEIYVFALDTFEFIKTIKLSDDIEKIQGGEYYDGKLYVGTNDIKRAVYTIDIGTGKVEKLFDRISYEYKIIDNFGGEGEDLTILPMENGTYIHTLQTGASFLDATLRHYK